MTKTEMKKFIKPLVKECMKEMLLEEGMLSSLISEVMKGQNKAPITESRQQVQPKKDLFADMKQKQKPQINEARRALADAIGKNAYVFEGLDPAPDPSSTAPDAGDSGIDLSVLGNIPGLKGFK